MPSGSQDRAKARNRTPASPRPETRLPGEEIWNGGSEEGVSGRNLTTGCGGAEPSGDQSGARPYGVANQWVWRRRLSDQWTTSQ